MNGHAASIHSLRHEESTTLLEEKSLSDLESDAGQADLESRFHNNNSNSNSSRRRKRATVWLFLSQTPQTWIRVISNLRPASSSRSSLLRIAIFLLPSFVQSRLIITQKHTGHNETKRRNQNLLHPTSYLDGMRGLAALFVFFCHYFYTCFVIAQSYGYGETNYHLLKLPIVRLFYQGPPMVAVFFVISGYALSLKPLKLIRSRNHEGLSNTMASLIFRRGFRLFLPTAISTLLIMFLLRAGAYEWTRDFAYDDTYMRNVQEIHYERMNSTAEQMADWGKEMFRFVHLWDWDAFTGSTAIDVHLWTIPVEFRSSMMLFLTLLGTARLKTAWRFGFVGLVVMGFCFRSARWEVLLFYGGMLMAEVDLIRGVHDQSHYCEQQQQQRLTGCGGERRENRGVGRAGDYSEEGLLLPRTSSSSSSHHHEKEQRAGAAAAASENPSIVTTTTATNTRTQNEKTNDTRRLIKNTFWISTSILALYLMSQPDQGGESTPGWETLTSLIPTWYTDLQDGYRYWQSIGAFLLVLSVGRSRAWQALFTSPGIQYLGKISYAMYLMHGPVLHTVGYAIERFVWTRITGVETDAAYIGGFMLASLAIVPIVIWVSDVFWRAVDEPVVRFGKWLEQRCSIE